MRKITASRTVGLGVVSAVGVLALAACSSSSPSSGSGAANAVNAANATTAANVSAPATQAPATSAPPTTQAAAATAPDPCQMVTNAEASALAGASFGPGKKSNGGSDCTYSSPTLRLVSVQAARANSAAEAQAYWAQEQAKLPDLMQREAQAPAAVHLTIKVTPLSGFGDRAALISGSATLQGITLAVNGMYLLKGATFVGFEAMAFNHPAPTTAAVEAQAKTVLGRM